MRTLLIALTSLSITHAASAQQATQDTSHVHSAQGAAATGLSDLAHQFAGSMRYAVSAPAHWNGRTALTLGGAALVVGGLSTTDGRLRDYIQSDKSKPLDDATSVVEPLGMQASLPLVGAFAVVGVAFDNAKARTIAAEGLASSLIAAGIITPALKAAVGRARPRSGQPAYTFHAFSGDASFPSGHTTQAFAIASVIATESTSHTVQFAAYGLATGVGLSRMYHNAHYLSDVAAGAFIGTVVGRSIARHGMASRVRITPSVTGDGNVGMVFQLRSGS